MCEPLSTCVWRDTVFDEGVMAVAVVTGLGLALLKKNFLTDCCSNAICGETHLVSFKPMVYIELVTQRPRWLGIVDR